MLCYSYNGNAKNWGRLTFSGGCFNRIVELISWNRRVRFHEPCSSGDINVLVGHTRIPQSDVLRGSGRGVTYEEMDFVVIGHDGPR